MIARETIRPHPPENVFLDLSVIIVNWNSAGYLRACVNSLYENTGGLTFEVIVVDNASFDGCNEMIQHEFPAVRFIQSWENLGFGRANNLAFEDSRGRYLLFLNPDTEILGTTLPLMVSFLEATPAAAVVGCRLLNSNLSVQTSSIQRFPTILNQILDADYLRSKFPKARLWGIRPLFEACAPVVVEAVSGACLMIRRNAFEEVGKFSTQFFMYMEDIDLCHKVRAQGSKTYYVPEATVVHHGGRSAEYAGESTIWMRQAIRDYLRLRRGRAYAATYRLTMVLLAVCRLVLISAALFLMPLGRYRRTLLQQGRVKWGKVFRWSLGLA